MAASLKNIEKSPYFSNGLTDSHALGTMTQVDSSNRVKS